MTTLVRWFIALPLGAFACGCSGSLPWLRGDLANHPAALVGEWVDVQKSSPPDSSIWVLQRNGDDEGVRITRGAAAAAHISRRHYGYWFVRGNSELCVSRRPARDAPSCTPFETAVDSTVNPPRRVVRLTAYAGAHRTGARLLLERR